MYNKGMTHRIFDKIVIVLMIIAATFLLSESVMAIHVCLILVSIIVLALNEFVSGRWMGFVLVVLGAAVIFIDPRVIVIGPAIIYILVGQRKRLELLTACAVTLLEAFHTATARDCIIMLLITGVAAYLAYTTIYYESEISRSEALFDKAREEAISNARKRRELRERTESDIYTATLKERNRIARDIHDNVGHMLTRAVVQLQAVLAINKDENIKPYLESVNSTVNDAMTNIRKSVHELHDDSIDLSIGINDIAGTLKDRFEVNVSTSIDSPVSNELKLQILGIIKECITNISKHSNGKKVIVEVVENVSFWRIKVYDNGKSEPLELSGSSASIVRSGDHGIGLGNIISRAANLGGRTTITGGADGFTVMVTIPKEK